MIRYKEFRVEDKNCLENDACTSDPCDIVQGWTTPVLVCGIGCTYPEISCDDGNACTDDSWDVYGWDTISCDKLFLPSCNELMFATKLGNTLNHNIAPSIQI